MQNIICIPQTDINSAANDISASINESGHLTPTGVHLNQLQAMPIIIHRSTQCLVIDKLDVTNSDIAIIWTPIFA